MIVSHKAEKKEIAEDRRIIESDSEMVENKGFIAITFLNDFFSEKDNTNIKDEIDDKENKNTRKQKYISKTGASCLRMSKSFYTKNQLIHILKSDILIGK